MDWLRDITRKQDPTITLRVLLAALILLTTLNVLLPTFVPTPPAIPLAADVRIMRPISTGKRK